MCTHPTHNASAFGLIELLLYQGVAILIITTLIQCLYYFQHEYRQNIAAFTKQQNVLMLRQLMQHDLDNAAFRPCGSKTTAIAIESDLNRLTLHDVVVHLSTLAEDLQTLNSNIKLVASNGLHPGDKLEVCNFRSTDSIIINSIYHNTIYFRQDNTSTLQQQYLTGTLVFRIAQIRYYLLQKTIYRADSARQAIAIMNGVEGFKIALDQQRLFATIKLEFTNGGTEFILQARDRNAAL